MYEEFELGYIKDVQYKHFWNRALKQPVVQLSKMFWQNIRWGLLDVILFVNSERGVCYDKRAMLCVCVCDNSNYILWKRSS